MIAKVPPPRGKGEPPVEGNTMGNLDTSLSEELVPLNFKVPASFRKEFKITAASQDMDMVEVLHEAFALFRRERTK